MLRPWHYSLKLDKTSSASIHLQLTQYFRTMIEGGQWLSGSALPSTREIAQQLEINRKTVARVYEELSAQGLIYSEPKRGTFVADSPAAMHKEAIPRTVSRPVAKHANDNPYSHMELQIQKTSLQHIRRAALHMHKLRAQDYDQSGLFSLKHMLATLLAHEKRFLVAPSQITVSNWPTIEQSLIEVMRPLPGRWLVDAHMPIAQREVLEKHGISFIVLPAIQRNHRSALAEQIEKYCINYPIAGIWCDSATLIAAEQREQAYEIVASRLKDYHLLLIDDQRQHVTSDSPAEPLSARYAHSIMLGSLYGHWCDTFNLHYVASPHDINQQLCATIDLQHQKIMLLHMLAQSELIKRGDYKKLISGIHRLLEQSADQVAA